MKTRICFFLTLLASAFLALPVFGAADGSIIGWGSQVIGGDLTKGFIAIAAGGDHSLGLKHDGSIVAWGFNYYGQCNIPSPNSGFIAISAGYEHSLGLKQDGSIVAWGDNKYGRCNIPSPNSGFIAISAGGGHSLGLKQDGSIVAWGYNYWGQCNIPSPNSGFIAISAGGDHSLGLKQDGSIVAWGYNYLGQCNIPSPNSGFIAISAGGCHSLGLKQDGSIIAWGWNNYGQCNIPSPNSGFIAISAGYWHSLGLKQDGSIVTWGNNSYGQCNIPSPNSGFIAIAAGRFHSLGLKQDGSIVAWGDNGDGQCNIPSPNSGFIAISAVGWHSLGLKQDGSIVAWGDNYYGQCNVPSPNSGFIAIAAGMYHSLGLKQDGSIVAWGANYFGQCNVPSPNTNFSTIAAGGSCYYYVGLSGHSLGLKQDGSIVAWGYNDYGQCNIPEPNTGFVAIAAGELHSLGLKQDGSIVAWGDNDYGQCNIPSPNTAFIAVAAGSRYSLALRGILTEISSTETTLIETLHARQGILDNGEVTGDMNGVFDFNNFDTVTITTGPWSGKGFSKGDCQTTLEGVPYTYKGIWHGFLLFKPQERKIYLKGSTSGEIAAIVEGYLTESVPDSNVYDHYQATWKIGRLGTTTTSATINLNGTLSYQSSSEFPATDLYILQSSIGGTVCGHYVGPLSSVINHIRIADSNNPYFGEGFSIISYVSESGQGEGWTHDKVVSPGIVEMKGLFDSPLFGIVSGTLDETKTPRTVFATIQRVDLGLPPMADLEVKTWGPTSVSPGQTINLIVEYRNQGLSNAYDTVVVAHLPREVEYVTSTNGGIYRWETHEVIWKLGIVPPKTKANLAATVIVQWGLPWGTQLETSTVIDTTGAEIDKYVTGISPIRDIQEYLNYQYPEPPLVEIFPTTDALPDLLLDPEFADLFSDATGMGFEAGDTVVRITANDGTVLISLPMVSSTQQKTLWVNRVTNPEQTNTYFLFEVSQDFLVLSNPEAVVKYFSDNSSENLTGFAGFGDITCIEKACWQYCIQEETSKVIVGKLLKKVRIRDLKWIGPVLRCMWQAMTSGWPSACKSANWNLADCARELSQKGINCLRGFEKEFEILKNISIADVLFWGNSVVTCTSKYMNEGGPPVITHPFQIWCVPGKEERHCHGGSGARYLIIEICNPDCQWELKSKVDCCPGGYCGADFGDIFPKCIPGKLGISWCPEEPPNTGSHTQTVTVARDPNRKLGPEGIVLPGQKLDYNVEYENEGEGIAFGVYFTDTLDEDLNDSTLEIGPVIDVNSGVQIAPPGTYSPATRTLTWFVGQVDPNQGGYAEFSVNVKNTASPGTEITNFATVYFPSVPEETRTNGVVSIVTPFGDIDQDGDVDLFDFAILAEQWLQPPAVPSADIAPQDGDGIVDWQDLRELTAHWLEGTSLAEHDLCPDDPNKVEPGACGCGVPDIDINGDGIPDCGFKYGDVNGDGEISAYDAALAAQCSEGLIELQDIQRFAADVDGNGCVSAEDADLIAQYAIGLITVFPVELMNPKPTTVPTCGCP
jgi:alpha-tubulin suppressor-like RCC1 family protein